MKRSLPILLLSTVLLAIPTLAQDLPTPEEYFGFEMGTDRKLARWDKMVDYYYLLGEASPRMNVVNMGESTLGNPFLVLYISSPENLNNLDELKQINARIADPRGYRPEQIDAAVDAGKVVMVQSMGLHSSEVAGSQMAVDLTYDMLTREDEEMMRILDNTISIFIPCFNPDGEIMVTDWYNETVGTEYEGLGLPFLYHHYIGHDNNRDAYMQNTVGSQYGGEIMFREWIPQAYIDHHQMGAFGPRLYLPPYAEPIRPDGDPLVWREMAVRCAYGLQRGGSRPLGRGERRHLLRLGALRVSLDYPVPQHRRHAHRIRQCAVSYTAVSASRPVAGRTPGVSGL